MEKLETVSERSRYCPVCGYDRRGAAGAICSECGKDVGAGVASRIPWVGRAYRGRVKSFVETCWLVVRRPSLFAEEARFRVSLKDARRFHWVCVVVATVIGTGMGAVAFGFRDLRWNLLAPTIVESMGTYITGVRLNDWDTPAFVFWDSWSILIPTALGLFLSLLLLQHVYRWLLGHPARDATERRRLRRMGLYFSVLLVGESFLLGLSLIAGMVVTEKPAWSTSAGALLHVLIVLMPALALGLRVIPTLILARHTGGKLPRRLGICFWTSLPIGTYLVVGATKLYFNRAGADPGVLPELVEMVSWMIGGGAMTMAVTWLFSERMRRQALRYTLIAVVYPLIYIIAPVYIAAAVFWLCGYVAIAVGSMLRYI